MDELIAAITRSTTRGECQCGQCFDKGAAADPIGHVADLVFFKVGLSRTPMKRERFDQISREAKAGAFATVDVFDGAEHGYIELGGWIGDQGLALRYMGLGVLLGAFELLTPLTVMGLTADHPLTMQMAGAGMVTVRAKPTAPGTDEAEGT